jgi:hypothetical protein
MRRGEAGQAALAYIRCEATQCKRASQAAGSERCDAMQGKSGHDDGVAMLGETGEVWPGGATAMVWFCMGDKAAQGSRDEAR